jgi:RNA polymerase sigma-70 factor (TIGR02943 family)
MKEAAPLKPEYWVERYGDMLFRFALQRVDDIAVAEDLVQESLLAALKAKDRFQGQSTEKTWLFAILKHKLIDFFRSKKKAAADIEVDAIAQTSEHYFNEDGTWRIQPTHWGSNPHDAYEKKEFQDMLYRCLSKLPQRLADSFIYREIEGLDTKEICKKLNITATNCGVMLYRARMALRGCIDKNYATR